MNNYRSFYLAIVGILSYSSYSFSTDIVQPASIEHHAQLWCEQVTPFLNPEQLHLATNVLYVLYANAVIDAKVRQFIIPITRLHQDIKSRIFTYQDATQELAALKILLERLSYVLGARTIYQHMLQTSIEYYNTKSDLFFSSALAELQQFGQQILAAYAEQSKDTTNTKLLKSAELLTAHVEPLQAIAHFHKGLAEDTYRDYFTSQETTRTIIPLAILDELIKNNMVALNNTENIINILDDSLHYALQLIDIAGELYKQHYTVLYNHVTAENSSPEYAATLFGMNDILSDEFKTMLPHPDHIFEHVLQTSKLYTQIEMTQ